MDYSRRQFLRLAAAGLPVAAASPLLFLGTAHAAPPPSEPYDQATADRIHNRSVEREILEAGKTPAQVKAEVDLRIRQIRGLVRGSIPLGVGGSA